MSINKFFLSQFQAENPEGKSQFNNNLIYARDSDDTLSFVTAIFKSLEVIEGITILDVTEITDEVLYPDSAGFNRVDYSRLNLIRITIKIEYDGERETIVRDLYAPRTIDDFFFYLNGATYFPVFQFIDRGTYCTKDKFTLKTMLLPLPFKTNVTHSITALNNPGYTYEGMLFVVDLFSSPVNPFLYFLAQKGLMETIQYLGYEDYFFVGAPDDFKSLDPAELLVFEVSKKVSVAVSTELMTKHQEHARMIASLISILRDQRFSLEDLEESEASLANEYDGAPDRIIWLRRLGKSFTKSNSKTNEKGQKILNSFVGIVEPRTQENLSYLDQSDREDTFAVVRWMMRDFTSLSRIDNMDLTTKRIRISEYIVYNLLMKMSNNRYRLVNTKRKQFKTLKNIFMYIDSHYLITQLVKNELLYYSNHCNQHDLFSVALKFTLSGRQASGSKSDIGIQQRGLHPSYIGRLSLTNASASSPGVTGTMTPFAKTEGQFFVADDLPLFPTITIPEKN